MKILVIGSGGREHALVWKLAQSLQATQLWVAPGNAGIAEEHLASNGNPVIPVPLGVEDLPQLLGFAKENHPDLIVVGPDNPLALGVVDLFQKNGFLIWGPNQKAAQFESSKIFSQNFMEKYGIPTARSGCFEDPISAKKFAESFQGRCAIKADGLALGKGVILAQNVEQAHQAIQQIMVDQSFGQAGTRVVIQEFLEGQEVSLHALCDGKTARLFPTAQDHKQAYEGDQGPNTGGMGAYSPAPFLSKPQIEEISRQILQPWLQGCFQETIDFRGILYPGLMLTSQGPKVIEFNARFGDPEAQVYLTRLQNDLVDLLLASVEGTLDKIELSWADHSSVCVVMASEGYPGSYQKGKVISGLHQAASIPHCKVFHAGTVRQDDRILTNGGRVLGVTAWGKSLSAAQSTAYHAVDVLSFEGAQVRRDIGAKGLKVVS